MTTLPYPYPTNVTNMTGWLSHVNTLTSNYFGTGIVAAIFVITFISMKNYDTEDAIIVSSFITAISSYFLHILGLVNQFVPILFTVLLAGSLFIGGGRIFKSRRNDL